MATLLSKERTIAAPGFNRWLIPPCALATHLCIGQAYALSVFNLPLTKELGITKSLPDDWSNREISWIFTIAIFVLGSSAAIFGKWVQSEGPRKSGFVAAICWGIGFLVGALGIHLHQLWLVYLGYGVIGGCGLGIGYITPVSTLIAWFPDRRGMATGMAIMGFGGGALVASPLSDMLMRHFASPTSTGVAATWLVLGAASLAMMTAGAFGYRVPAPGWKPAGWTALPEKARTLVTSINVTPASAIRTPQFWLLWVVLCFNVAAGISVIGQASSMIQEVFKGTITPSAAAGFVGLLSLFNMAWTLFLGFALGQDRAQGDLRVILHSGSRALCARPTERADRQRGPLRRLLLHHPDDVRRRFRGRSPPIWPTCSATGYVSAVHGRLLTAWSVAGGLGPQLITNVRQYEIDAGVPKYQAYNVTMYIMAALLVVGFFANLAVRPVGDRFAERTEPQAPTGSPRAALAQR